MKITVKPMLLTDAGLVPEEPVEIETDITKEDFQAYANLFCKCDEPSDDWLSSDDWLFCNDGECSEIRKHHYHCRTCGKITQIG